MAGETFETANILIDEEKLAVVIGDIFLAVVNNNGNLALAIRAAVSTKLVSNEVALDIFHKMKSEGFFELNSSFLPYLTEAGVELYRTRTLGSVDVIRLADEVIEGEDRRKVLGQRLAALTHTVQTPLVQIEQQ